MSDETVKAEPPNTQVRLAYERTRVAYDRTMMAWIRTGTSLISIGFAIYKFFQLDMKATGIQDTRMIGPREFALMMVGAGLLAVVLGSFDHWRNMRSIRAQDASLPRSMAGVLTACILCLGALALFAVIFKK